MPDEHDIPVKVVDRRWWARTDEGDDAGVDRSAKPTYVADLERRVAESEKQAQEYLAKYRQASQEFEDARAITSYLDQLGVSDAAQAHCVEAKPALLWPIDELAGAAPGAVDGYDRQAGAG